MRTVLGAIFLACSWCWCIGMFFPVLMVRDFGVWGWVAFIVPNCLGAMMVGLIHARRGGAEGVVERHGAMARVFSVVTMLFHVSFLSWFVPTMTGGFGADGVGVLALVMGVVVASAVVGAYWRKAGVWLAAGAVVLGVSIVCGVMANGAGGLGVPGSDGRFGMMSLAFFAPAVALGFLTCPHLDLTFLRIRREMAGSRGSLAFVLGFAVFFPALMVLTLLYARSVLDGAVSGWIVAHIVVQAWFTMGAHFRELMGGAGDGRADAGWRGVPIRVSVLIAVVAGVSFMSRGWDAVAGMAATEALYKMFITFYGVVFPAYVWVVMVPRRRGGASMRWVLWGSVGVALAFAKFGYMDEVWVLSLGIPAAVLAGPWVGKMVGRSG